MARRLHNQSWKFRKLCQGLQSEIPCYRTYLSQAYRCEDTWNERLKTPLLLNLNAGDYAYQLERKYFREGKVSSIDVDLFMNKLEPTYARNMTQDLDELLKRLRRSPETYRTLPSTPHAALRILLDTKRIKLLLKLLQNPLEYGVFPDYYISNLLMDTFLEDKNYTAAARVASGLMLQEDFGPPLTRALALASCFSYVTSEDNLPWEDYTVKPKDPEEKVKIRISYLRNPHFDDHFDLIEPNHIVGKTLAWGGPTVGGVIGLNTEVLGWSLYNKWNELSSRLRTATADSVPLDASVINRVKDDINATEDIECREEIMSLISQLESKCDKDVNLGKLIQDLVKEECSKAEQIDIEAQKQVYAEWGKLREQEVQAQLEEYRRKQLLEEIERKKKELKEKEDIIYFFENKHKLELQLDKKPIRVPKNPYFFFPYKTKEKKTIDEEYIPPEVKRRH